MNQIDYYYIYLCLKELVKIKKITKNVANKLLKEYEGQFKPEFKYKIE